MQQPSTSTTSPGLWSFVRPWVQAGTAGAVTITFTFGPAHDCHRATLECAFTANEHHSHQERSVDPTLARITSAVTTSASSSSPVAPPPVRITDKVGVKDSVVAELRDEPQF